jgi:hypothetical protein
MNREFTGQIKRASCRFNRIDVAYQIGDGHVRRGQLLDVAFLGTEIRDRRRVAFFCDQVLAPAAQRFVGIVVNFAAFYIRKIWIEQAS